MKILDIIRAFKNDFTEKTEEEALCVYFEEDDLVNFWIKYDDLSTSEFIWEDYIYRIVVDIESKHIKALLREMRVRMLKPIGSIKVLRRILFSHISLLFGMCSSQSSLILNAFYGNSLSRIPSL